MPLPPPFLIPGTTTCYPNLKINADHCKKKLNTEKKTPQNRKNSRFSWVYGQK